MPALKLDGSPDVSVESRERLVRLREENPGTIRAARASFLLGLLAVEEGGAGALAYLDTAAGLKDIPDYLAFYRGRAHALEKDYKKTVSAFDSLIKDYPGSALVPEASYLKSIALLEDGRAEEARDGMRAFVSAYPDNRLAPEALLKSAEASVLLGQFDEAAATIRKILTDFPASLAANGADALFREIAAGEGKAPDFTPAERYRRGRRLFNNARFEEAASEFSALAADPSGEFHDRAMINSIVSKVRLKDYAGASRVLSAYLDGSRTPPKERELDALYWSSLVSLRQGSENGLREAVERLSAKYPLSIERARALLFLARHYASRNMAPEAIETYKKVIDGFKGTASAEKAAWSTGWLYYRSGRFEDAFKVFSVHPASGGELPRFLYWAGRSAENMGGIDEAARRYRLLCAAYGADYYCRMAEKRLGSLDPAFSMATASSTGVTKPSVEAGKLSFEGNASSIFTDPHYLAARELMTLGLGERAAAEITMLMKAHSGEPGALVELAGLFYQAEDFYSAFRVYNSYLSRLASNGAGNPFDLSTLSFPPRLVELARRKSPPGSVDPYLIAAVIREESA
ncbi:MAG: tetratricopeptide repeat protein, partial [Deltaproteobacteria bacterium]|nr:tetratricopeptide repeat protein [Deltaproteobacteria bacterium]